MIIITCLNAILPHNAFDIIKCGREAEYKGIELEIRMKARKIVC
jgi:hypothetical protein